MVILVINTLIQIVLRVISVRHGFILLVCVIFLLNTQRIYSNQNTNKTSEKDIPDEAYDFSSDDFDQPQKNSNDISGKSHFKQRFQVFGYLRTEYYTFFQDTKEYSGQMLKNRLTPGFLAEMRLKTNWKIESNLSIHSEFLYQGYYGSYNPIVLYERWNLLSTTTKSSIIQSGGSNSDYQQSFLIDQAYFSADWKALTLKVGKQVIGWGTGYFVNPTDKINNKDFINASEQLLGTTSIFFQINLAKDTGIRSYVAFEDRSHKKYTFIDGAQFPNIPLGIKFRTKISSWDISIGYIREVFYNSANVTQPDYERANYAILDFSGEIKIGIYGEVAFRLPDKEFSPVNFNEIFEGLIGIDYTFKIGLNFRIEYLRHGKGETSKFSYDINKVFSRKQIFLARDYIFLYLNKKWGYNYTTTLIGISNINDGSFVIIPEISILAFNNLEFRFGAYIMFGPSGSEFDGRLKSTNVNTGQPTTIDVTQQVFYIKAKVSF